jgi:LysR family transcriptional regulator for metE and metH
MIDLSQLRIIQALHRQGTLTEAAATLHLTQPALTHQIRALEQRLGTRLWEKAGRRLRLTRAGELLLETAEHVLPVLEQAERNLRALAEGRQGLLRIGVECFPCYQWLTGVIGAFLGQLPEVDIDIVNRFRFDGLTGLAQRHIDLLVTPDPQPRKGICFERLADYRLVLLVTADSPLARLDHVEPADLSGERLLSFPVPVERLDVFTRFLLPAGQAPAAVKEIESLELMLQLVGLGRGVCVLPSWLAAQQVAAGRVRALELGAEGLHSSLYLGLREQDAGLGYLQAFIALGKELAVSSFRAG